MKYPFSAGIRPRLPVFYPCYISVSSSKLKAIQVGQRPRVWARLQETCLFSLCFKASLSYCSGHFHFPYRPIRWVSLLPKAWDLTQTGNKFPQSLYEPEAHILFRGSQRVVFISNGPSIHQCVKHNNHRTDCTLLAFKALIKPIFALKASSNWFIYLPKVCQILGDFWDHLIKMSRDGSSSCFLGNRSCLGSTPPSHPVQLENHLTVIKLF